MSEIEERARMLAGLLGVGTGFKIRRIEAAFLAEQRLAFERAAEIARAQESWWDESKIAICQSISNAILAEIDQPPTPPGETP
jgi:hypothetical protein